MNRNRELKFRVFDPAVKAWKYFSLSNVTVPDRLLEQHSYPVQQFTGIKDKIGREIYEGDLIKGLFDYGPVGFVEQTLPVVWCEENGGYRWSYWDLKTVKVVGNMITDGIGGVAISLDNEETEALMRQAADILVDNRDKICNK